MTALNFSRNTARTRFAHNNTCDNITNTPVQSFIDNVLTYQTVGTSGFFFFACIPIGCTR